MKRVLVIVVLLATSLFAGDIDKRAENSIAAYLKAIGGVDNLKAVKSVVMYGTMYSQGMPLQMTMYVVPPNKAYQKLTVDNFDFGGGGTNGVDAWATTPMGTFYLTGELKEAAMIQADIFPLLNFQEQVTELSYLDTVIVKGKDAEKIMSVLAGDTVYHYFDANTHYLIKSESGDGSLAFSEHKPVGNVVMHHKTTGQGFGGAIVIGLDSILTNLPMPDSLFLMPPDAQPLPESLMEGIESRGE